MVLEQGEALGPHHWAEEGGEIQGAEGRGREASSDKDLIWQSHVVGGAVISGRRAGLAGVWVQGGKGQWKRRVGCLLGVGQLSPSSHRGGLKRG